MASNKTTEYYIPNHKNNVEKKMESLCLDLAQRARDHDNSKLESPEYFAWKKMDEEPRYPYGTPEYFDKKRRYDYVFQEHYKNPKNRHHPEHWPNGVEDMNLLDLIEFLCDMFSYKEANISYSEAVEMLQTQVKRFKISDDLAWILLNTVKEYFCNFGGPEFVPDKKVQEQDSIYKAQRSFYTTGAYIDVYA